MLEKKHCRRCGSEILEGNTHCVFCGSTDIGVKPENQMYAQNEKGSKWMLLPKLATAAFFVVFFVVLGIILVSAIRMFLMF